MSGLSARAFRLVERGPFVEVRFAVSADHERALRASGASTPAPLEFLALVDTGANLTAVRAGTLALLRVPPTGTRPVRSSDGTALEAPCYLGRLLFSGGVEIPTTATECLHASSQVACIVGRDVLAHGRFVYDGRAGICGLTLRGVEVPMAAPPDPVGPIS